MFVIESIKYTTGAALLLFASAVVAQYPEKPINFILSSQHSEAIEPFALLIAEEFKAQYNNKATVKARKTHQNAVALFNGAIELASAEADGYSIGVFDGVVPIYSSNADIPVLETAKFDALGIFATIPYVLLAKKEASFKNLSGLTNYATSNQVSLGHVGESMVATRLVLAYGKNAGFDINAQSYESINCDSLNNGDVEMIIAKLSSVAECLSSAKPLAVIADDRIGLVPNTPTLGEIDPTLDHAVWAGLFIRSDTPIEIKDWIAAKVAKALSSAQSKELAIELGISVYWQDATRSAQRIHVDRGTMLEVDRILELSFID